MKSFILFGAAAAVNQFSYRTTAEGEVCDAADADNSNLCGMFGDANWATAWPACDGKTQSPIDLKHMDADVKDIPDLQVYGPNSSECGETTGTCTWTHSKNGHGVKWVPKDCLMCAKRDGKQYNLLQCHMHGPAEHAIAGKRSALEIHCVHQLTTASGYDDLLVIGTLLNGAETSDVKDIDESLEASYQILGDENKETGDMKAVYPASFSSTASGYYHYDGSLTTPPCTASQHWYVADKIYNVKNAQVDGFRAIMKEKAIVDQKMMAKIDEIDLKHLASVTPKLEADDQMSARDIQELNDRKIYHVRLVETAQTDKDGKAAADKDEATKKDGNAALALAAAGIVAMLF